MKTLKRILGEGAHNHGILVSKSLKKFDPNLADLVRSGNFKDAANIISTHKNKKDIHDALKKYPDAHHAINQHLPDHGLTGGHEPGSKDHWTHLAGKIAAAGKGVLETDGDKNDQGGNKFNKHQKDLDDAVEHAREHFAPRDDDVDFDDAIIHGAQDPEYTYDELIKSKHEK